MNFVVVVAVAGSHLVHGQRAGLVAGDARRAAQRLYCLQVLDEHVAAFHLNGCKAQGYCELGEKTLGHLTKCYNFILEEGGRVRWPR